MFEGLKVVISLRGEGDTSVPTSLASTSQAAVVVCHHHASLGSPAFLSCRIQTPKLCRSVVTSANYNLQALWRHQVEDIMSGPAPAVPPVAYMSELVDDEGHSEVFTNMRDGEVPAITV
ncbi:hypothetical protein E2C01_031378 [Portunus trituberculatus]|uniref:Uncharacterized protein n=1 Tax=Portunus trituberculatus TaxID=210409 RepID=A0A5B7EYE6_PORTR|nr:hypothetical protein [Portunus trituberculatus]